MSGCARAGGWGGKRTDGLLITIWIYVSPHVSKENRLHAYFAFNVGLTANLAKLLGNNGLLGTGSYTTLVLECKLPDEYDLLRRGYREAENDRVGEVCGSMVD